MTLAGILDCDYLLDLDRVVTSAGREVGEYTRDMYRAILGEWSICVLEVASKSTVRFMPTQMYLEGRII